MYITYLQIGAKFDTISCTKNGTNLLIANLYKFKKIEVLLAIYV